LRIYIENDTLFESGELLENKMFVDIFTSRYDISKYKILVLKIKIKDWTSTLTSLYKVEIF
jgi:hypothetical protein